MTTLAPAPIRPLGVAEILDGAVRLLRRNARAALSISVPFAIVNTGLGALLQYATIDSQDAVTIAAVGGLILGAGLGAVLTGLLAPVYSSAMLGRRLSAGDALKMVGRKVWALLGLGLIVTLAEGAGLVALYVLGVWLWGIWAVAAPALVLESTGVRGALGRSRNLVRGSFWRVWGIRALGYLLTSVLGLFVTIPFAVLAGAVSSVNLFDTSGDTSNAAVFVTILSIGSLISKALLSPISSAIDVLLYTDLRMRREGMDIVLGMPPAPDVAQPVVSAW
jgi:hypothetical protein